MRVFDAPIRVGNQHQLLFDTSGTHWQPLSCNEFMLQSRIIVGCLRLTFGDPSASIRSMPEHIKKKLSEEIAVLEHELNHELPKELKKAVAMGDLSENAEYHMAKQRQEFVRARLGQLKQRMADLSMVNMANIPKGPGGHRFHRSGVRLHQGRRDHVQAGHQRRVGCYTGVNFHQLAYRTRLDGQEGGRRQRSCYTDG